FSQGFTGMNPKAQIVEVIIENPDEGGSDWFSVSSEFYKHVKRVVSKRIAGLILVQDFRQCGECGLLLESDAEKGHSNRHRLHQVRVLQFRQQLRASSSCIWPHFAESANESVAVVNPMRDEFIVIEEFY